MSTSDNKLEITATPEYRAGESLWYDTLNGRFFKEEKQNGTDASDSMTPEDILFKIPQGESARLNVTLSVDDWGSLTIYDSENNEKLSLKLTSEEEEAGPRGGHVYWTKTGAVSLPAGEYTIHVEQSNVTYPEKYDSRHNISKCEVSLTAKKLLPRPVKILVKGKPCEEVYRQAITYPEHKVKSDGSLQFYDVPVFDMLVQGTDDDGKKQELAFQVIRYMPGYNPGGKWPQHEKIDEVKMIGLSDEQKHVCPEYKDYVLHGALAPADDGAFVIYDTHYLHDGPDGNLPDEVFGALGCLEVYGSKGFEALKEAVRSLSGMVSEDDTDEVLKKFCSKKLLTIALEAAVSPQVVPNKE